MNKNVVSGLLWSVSFLHRLLLVMCRLSMAVGNLSKGSVSASVSKGGYAEVYVDGVLVGAHQGGSISHFAVEIGGAMKY